MRSLTKLALSMQWAESVMKHSRRILLIVLLAPLVAAGQQPGNRGGVVVVDKMVATVNGELITYSDLLWQLALQPNTPLDSPSSEDLNRALDLLIRQLLIGQEAEKLPSINPSDEEINAALKQLLEHFPSRAEFEERARRVGLSGEQLKELVRRRVRIDKYLDFRFRSFTVVTQKEVEDYYRDVWVPRFRRRQPGSLLPKFEEVRAEIEKTLTEDKTESDLTTFLDEARERAEVIILNPV